MPLNDRIVPYRLENGNIKGVNGQRHFDFIIDTNGNLVIGQKHHFLGNVNGVLAVGELRLNGQGMIRNINNKSGHYRPSVDESMNYPKILQNSGLNIKGATLDPYLMKADHKGMIFLLEKTKSQVIKQYGESDGISLYLKFIADGADYKNYDYPYAGFGEEKIAYADGKRADLSFTGKMLYQVERTSEHQYYNTAVGRMMLHNYHRHWAQVTDPALNFIPILGLLVTIPDVIEGGKYVGQSFANMQHEDYSEAAMNMGVGVLLAAGGKGNGAKGTTFNRSYVEANIAASRLAR